MHMSEVVALLAEGVDRNKIWEWKFYKIKRSPSSRRAWIEISHRESSSASGPVALLAEGVDRNELPICVDVEDNKSPSSRRAWIEIV